MRIEKNILDVLNIATEKGLKDVEIRIRGNFIKGKAEKGLVELWVGGKDRFCCSSLAELKAALKEHEDLKWMNK